MEFQTPQGYPTLMERLFPHWEYSDGVINAQDIAALLQNVVQPELLMTSSEEGLLLQQLIDQYDTSGKGLLDFESAVKVFFRFLMKQSSSSRNQGDEFILRHEDGNCSRITLEDFVMFV